MKEKKVSVFRAFKNRNYSLFFCGQSISQIGTWMQRTAVSWVIYSLTHSAFMLGLTVFAQQFPSFLLSLYGGIISDRYHRHRILLITQTASMIQSVLLAILILTNHYVVWEILTLSVILGIINAFDVPARQPLIHEMINDREDISNAMAFNSAMVNIARLIGPALSGILLQSLGAGICFSLNALSFIAVIVSLLLMKLPPFHPPQKKKAAISELREGLDYLNRTAPIRNVILLLIFLSFLVLPYDTLLPVFAKNVFHGNARTFGYITSAIGLGAILGSLILASVKKGTDLKKILIAGIGVLGIGLIGFSSIPSFSFSIPVAIVIGLAAMMPMTICITILQMEAQPAMRGRVMSYVAMGYFGMLPLGSLLTGAISQKIQAPVTMFIQGIIALIIAIVFSRFLKKETAQEEIRSLRKVEEEIAGNF
jgi:MFS family permease